MYRLGILILTSLISSFTLAHPGHDHDSITSGLVHFFWVLPAIVAVGLFVYYKRKVALMSKEKSQK